MIKNDEVEENLYTKDDLFEIVSSIHSDAFSILVDALESENISFGEKALVHYILNKYLSLSEALIYEVLNDYVFENDEIFSC